MGLATNLHHGAVWRFWRKMPTLIPSSEWDCSSNTSSYCATPLYRVLVPTRARLRMQLTLLSFCSGLWLQ